MAQMTVAPEWLVEQLGKIRKQRPELVDAALADLLNVNPELRWSLVLNAYLDEEVNLGKAAELLDLHELELRRQFIELGVPLRLGPEDDAEAAAEARALNSWFDEDGAAP